MEFTNKSVNKTWVASGITRGSGLVYEYRNQSHNKLGIQYDLLQNPIIVLTNWVKQ